MLSLPLLFLLAAPGTPVDEGVLRARVDRLGGADAGIGIAMAIVDPQGTRYVSYGQTGRGSAIGTDTGFEIASVTKVFTGLLLAEMVRRGEVALDDPVARFLPDVVLPARAGARPIALLDLVTHTSGLPFMPDDLPALDDPAGAAAYDADGLHRFLARARLADAPGTTWDYSNLGYFLLGEALARRAGLDFETLLATRILGPLGLERTQFVRAPSPAMAVGHDAVLGPAPYFASMPVFSRMPAAGGLVSTPRDLARFLAIVLGREPSPLAPALRSMLDVTRPKGRDGERQAVGWVVEGDGPSRLVLHDGGSFGFASALAFRPSTGTGVVVLSNQLAGVVDLARHTLRPELPLDTPTATKRVAIALEAAVLDDYAGSYDGGEEGTFEVLHERDALTLRFPAEWGLPPMRVRPESRTAFFASQLPLRVAFEVDAAGAVTGMKVFPPRGQGAIETRRRP
jgi:CubicO group peptidase (beta-lactamase class C family)